MDLFSRGKQSPEQSTKPKSIPTEKVSTEETLVSSVSPEKVYVLQATRLPALHKKLVRAQVRVPKDQSLSLFVPMTDPLKTTGLKMEEAVMCPDDNDCVTLIVENSGLSPTHLQKGEVLGQLEPVHLTENLNGETLEIVCNVSLSKDDGAEARRKRLLEVLQVEQGHLSTGQYQQLLSFLADHHEQFALDPLELGSTNRVTHSIDTGRHPPIKQHPRRLPFALRPKVESMVDRMLEQGVITPSCSPWASPIVLIQKKDSTHRFCVDYRRLNSVTKMDVFPLP